jgi:hypothetical protein
VRHSLKLLLFLIVSVPLQAQPAANLTPPVQLTAAEDHQRMMDLLHITALRPAPIPTPNRPNTANYDESKANPYPNLPDPLTLNNGKKVTSAKIWQTQRRPQLIEIFDREILGRIPKNVPSIHWRVVSTTHETQDGIPVVTKNLLGHVDNSAYPLIAVDIKATLTTPDDAPGPVPIILELTFEDYPQPNRRDGTPQAPLPTAPNAQWKQDVIHKGWGYALLYPTTIQADNGAGLTQGIIGLCNHGQPRSLEDWGVLRAWAWGASRVLDYLQTDQSVDARQIAIEGHSRMGKASLIAMAYDPRFVVAYINSSGAGGANLARRHFGEQLENTAGPGSYHWMAGNYIKYAASPPKKSPPPTCPSTCTSSSPYAPRAPSSTAGAPPPTTAGPTFTAPSSPRSPPAPSTVSWAQKTSAPPPSRPSAPPSSPAISPSTSTPTATTPRLTSPLSSPSPAAT